MRPDRPPGAERDRGPAATPDPPRRALPPRSRQQGSTAASVPPGAVRRLIALSDERDRWERLALDWARRAYRSGCQDGLRAGRVDGFRLGYAAASADWLAAGPAPRAGSGEA